MPRNLATPVNSETGLGTLVISLSAKARTCHPAEPRTGSPPTLIPSRVLDSRAASDLATCANDRSKASLQLGRPVVDEDRRRRSMAFLHNRAVPFGTTPTALPFRSRRRTAAAAKPPHVGAGTPPARAPVVPQMVSPAPSQQPEVQVSHRKAGIQANRDFTMSHRKRPVPGGVRGRGPARSARPRSACPHRAIGGIPLLLLPAADDASTAPHAATEGRGTAKLHGRALIMSSASANRSRRKRLSATPRLQATVLVRGAGPESREAGR